MFDMNTASRALQQLAAEKIEVPAIGWTPTSSGPSSEDWVTAARVYFFRADTGERDHISVAWGELRQ